MSKTSSCLIVLLVVCTTLKSCVVAVRFKSLEDLLKYHEQQQNPGTEEEMTSTLQSEGLMTGTSLPPSVPAHRHNHHQQNEDTEEEHGANQPDINNPHQKEDTEEEHGANQPYINNPRQKEDTEEELGSGKEPTSILPTEVPMTTRQKTTCCLLGEQAGMKRHHCNPDNYMPRFRDHNRRHNFKQSNRHPSMEKSQFDKCTSGIIRRHAEEFRTCCQEAYKRLWQRERGEENVGHGRIHLIEVPI